MRPYRNTFSREFTLTAFFTFVGFNFLSWGPIEELLGFKFRSLCWTFQNKSSQTPIMFILWTTYIIDYVN